MNLDFLLLLLKAPSLHLLMVIHLPVGHASFYSLYKLKVVAPKMSDKGWIRQGAPEEDKELEFIV